MEQGEDRRREATSPAEPGLVDQDQVTNAGLTRDLALFNLAIDSKLRGCDVVAVRVDDVASNSYALDRATVRQRKTGRPVRFGLTDQTPTGRTPTSRGE